MKLFLTAASILFLLISFPKAISAQQPTSLASEMTTAPQENTYRAQVETIVEEGTTHVGDISNPYQNVIVKLLDGPNKGELIPIRHGEIFTLKEEMVVTEGEKVVVLEFPRPDGSLEYIITEKYRLDTLLMFAVVFAILVLAIARWRGLGSIIGLGISLVVITFYIVPQILNGRDPLLISISGAAAIMLMTLYLAHGFSKKTTVALAATIISFIGISVFSFLLTHVADMSGLGSEDAYALQYGGVSSLNFSGLFLGGILIGALGVLDDVTTSLSASVFEVARNHKKKTFLSLLKSGMNVGRDHIASLVNTLVLAYAGAALPLFLFFVVNPGNKPLWAILNNELVAEEIVRTLGGSFGLVLAVPITALLAAWIASRE